MTQYVNPEEYEYLTKHVNQYLFEVKIRKLGQKEYISFIVKYENYK